MRKGLIAAAGVVALCVPAGASAGLDDYLDNPGRQESFTVTACAGHGAFGIFEGERGGFVPGDAQQGGIGDTTGPANSEVGRVCGDLPPPG
jgi:hypothetical protein